MSACDGVFTWLDSVGVLYGRKKKDDKTDSRSRLRRRRPDVANCFRRGGGPDGPRGRSGRSPVRRLAGQAQGLGRGGLADPGDARRPVRQPARVWTVATDPQDARTFLYVGGPRNTYASQATVCRSADGGQDVAQPDGDVGAAGEEFGGGGFGSARGLVHPGQPQDAGGVGERPVLRDVEDRAALAGRDWPARRPRVRTKGR